MEDHEVWNALKVISVVLQDHAAGQHAAKFSYEAGLIGAL
jgi:hypothetical protein